MCGPGEEAIWKWHRIVRSCNCASSISSNGGMNSSAPWFSSKIARPGNERRKPTPPRNRAEAPASLPTTGNARAPPRRRCGGAQRPGRSGPPAVVLEEITRLKALYMGFQYRALARMLFGTTGYWIDHKTVKRLWQHSPVAAQGELPLGDYHSHPERYQARVQVLQLYAQGWTKRSLSQFLHVSRPTVHTWIRRFATEHFAGLVGH